METPDTEWDPCAELEKALTKSPFEPRTATVALASVRTGIVDTLLASDQATLVALAERLSSMAHVLVDLQQPSVESNHSYHLGRLSSLADVAAEGADRVRPAGTDAWVHDREHLIRILRELGSSESVMSHIALTRQLGAYASQITRWLDELEEGGLVVCDRVKNRRYARLSAVGRKFVDDLPRTVHHEHRASNTAYRDSPSIDEEPETAPTPPIIWTKSPTHAETRV